MCGILAAGAAVLDRCPRGQPVYKAVMEGVKIDDRTGFQ